MSNPSLLLIPDRYKAGKLYSQIPDTGAGDLSFTRVGDTATRVNSQGLIEPVLADIPRIDYTGGGCGKLLLEPQRTNLLTFSEQMNNATWTPFRSSVTSNATISPDGLNNAEKLIQQSGANDAGGIFQIATIANATAYTYSFFAKADGFSWCFARVSNSPSDFYAWFNLATGVLGSTQGSVTSSIVSYGNGWYRCSMTFTSVSTSSVSHIYIANSNNSDQTPGADGVKGIYAYGAQLEVGSYATSYIPTLGASVTRGADAASKTGISSLIGQTQGTLYAEISATNFADGSSIFTISDGTANNRITLQKQSSSRLRAIVTTASGTVADISTVSGQVTGTYKIAFAYAANDFVLYVNGTQIGTDTIGAVPATSKVNFGSSSTDTTQLNDRIRAAALYTSRLSNAELETLTTL